MHAASPDADICWQQHFSNDQKSPAQLETFFEPPALSDREQQGLIKALETTFVLTWNTLRDLLRSQGNNELLGSRDTLRKAFRLGLLSNGETWMLMLEDSKLTNQTDNRSTAEEIATNTSQRYFNCFQDLRTRLLQRQEARTDCHG